MANEVAVVDEKRLAELTAEMGANPSQNAARGPGRLKVNSREVDASGRDLKKGVYYVDDGDEPVYAKTVEFRPLGQTLQWMDYDNDENKFVNKTLQIRDFRQEPRDEQGTLRCGKPKSDVLKDMPKAEQKKYQSIKCVRHIQGIVSYTGKTVTGEEVVVENKPCVFSMKGSNFNQFHDEYVKKLPSGANMYDFWATLSAERRVSESGTVVYFVTHFEFDANKPVPVTTEMLDTMDVFARLIRAENDKIEEKYEAALRNRQEDDDAIDAADIGAEYESLDADFEEAS